MISKAFRFPVAAVVALSFGAVPLFDIRAQQRPDDPIELVPHRAIYDLKLLRSGGKRSLESVRGRILYDFSGSRCEGYALQFRQVTELDSGEGKSVTSDLRTTNWEQGDGKRFRFTVQNFLGGQEGEMIEGQAEQEPSGTVATLTKPQPKKMELGSIIFPSEHMRRIIAAAREGKSLLEIAVYDGSENGEKVYNTLTVIGQPVASDRQPTDAAAGQKELTGVRRWPVTVSYFDRSAGKDGEQTPAYSISFEAYENGISHALKLDYGDFVLVGEMTSLEVKQAKPCP